VRGYHALAELRVLGLEARLVGALLLHFARFLVYRPVYRKFRANLGTATGVVYI
jgi:hypothetical protein